MAGAPVASVMSVAPVVPVMSIEPMEDRALTADEVKAKKKLKDSLGGRLTEIADLFKQWDNDGNGMIDRLEFRQAVGALGYEAPTIVIDSVFSDYDADGSGEMEYKEYVRYQLRDSLQRSASRVMDLFRKWDDDHSGTVSKKEFRKAIREIGFDAPKESLDELFDEMDKDTSGAVDFKELNSLLRQGATVTLAKELQVGGAGKIQLSARGKYSLRGGDPKARSSRSSSPPRPPPVSVKSPSSSTSSTQAPNMNDRALRVQEAKREFSERQRARLTPRAPKTPLRSVPDLMDLGWAGSSSATPAAEPPADVAASGGGRSRASTVTFAPSDEVGNLQPDGRAKSGWDA